MKRVRRVLQTVLIMLISMCLGLMDGMTVLGQEAVVLNDYVLDAAGEVLGNVSSLSFEVTDIRTSQTTLFDGDDGKNAIIVFGGVYTCGNTQEALKSIDKILECVDSDVLNAYVFDVKGSSDEELISALSNLGISNDIFVTSVSKSTQYTSFYRQSISVAGISGQFSIPLILYKDSAGNIYQCSTGYISTDAMVEAVEAGGVETTYGVDRSNVTVKGTSLYSEAYEILDMVNQERAAEGLPALTMDTELLAAAMQRAAECSVYYGHTRPNGTSCFSVSSSMKGENVAAGYPNAASVMNGWMNSPGHRANILQSGFQSIGVGAYYIGGNYYWVQVFGNGAGDDVSRPADEILEYEIITDPNYAEFEMSLSQNTISVNETATAKVYANNTTYYGTQTPIEASSFTWSSDSTAVTVDQAGNIKGVAGGIANVTATNKANANMSLVAQIEVVGESSGATTPSTPDTPSVINGLKQASDGNWYYYVNGVVNTGYTGLVCDDTVGWWYVENGAINFGYDGLIQHGDAWWCVVGGRLAFEYTGLWNDPAVGWWYVENGAINFGYNGLIQHGDAWWCVVGGRLAFEYTGLWSDPTVGWWYVENGAINFGYNGLIQHGDAWWCVIGGRLAFEYTGLWSDPAVGWWYVENGAINFGYNGLIQYGDAWWCVAGGRLAFEYTGLWSDPAVGWWYVENGAINFGYTGSVYYEGATYNVVGGMVVF